MRTAYSIAAFGLLLSSLHAQDKDAWDFVPGEKLLLFDDYTDMPRGGAPPHWKVRGTALRLVEGRLAASTGNESVLWPNVAKWPDNFTIEIEVSYKPAAGDDSSMRVLDWTFLAGEDNWRMHTAFTLNAVNECSVFLEIADPGEAQRQACRLQPDKPNKFAIWAQDGRLRVYVNGDRIVDMNQVKFKFDRVSLRISPDQLPVSLGPVRIAQSAPDFSQTIFSSGRYVSHGILFDVNSDKIKPESQPVLRQIADALSAQNGLKLRIEGHTDSTGNAAANLDLSKRRAASVKSALTGMGIAADRLTTEGLGDTRPAAKNDTPQGRAENRRVEFVKL